ncbi:MAG: helix-turn-helix domain-containing protein [Myxococcales bacterium]|nr:helix-turn-helix domain-containing protein [Myxococcales bacterium]
MAAPRVAVLAYDQLCTFEYGIAVELFVLPRPDLGVPWYRTTIVNADAPRPARGLGGVVVRGAGLAAIDRADLIVLPGWRRHETPAPRLAQALRRAAARGARFFSICSGAFLLAACGLLDGRRATTHWLYVDEFAARFPRVTLAPDALYVDDGPILTSAGSAAGLDAGLHLITRDHGARIANVVARRVVASPHRAGGQRQFIDGPVPTPGEPELAPLLDWARRHLDQPLGVDELAARAHQSPRTFLRRFGRATGTSPKQWLQRERMLHARRLLESSRLSLDEVSAACGYATAQAFRLAFRAAVGTAPSRYRAQFALRLPVPARVSRRSGRSASAAGRGA